MITAIMYEDLCEDAKAIRQQVFVEEQGFQNEFDEIDARARHVVLYEDGRPAATGRWYVEGEQVVIGRVAVLPAFRRLHLGAQVVCRLEEDAAAAGYTVITLSAQCRVQGFYEKQGYQAVGEIYMDEFCPHIRMEKSF